MRTAHACHKHTDGFAVALSKRLFRITLANIVSLKSIKNTFQSLCPSTLRRPICLRICIIVPWYLHHIVHLCTGEGKSPLSKINEIEVANIFRNLFLYKRPSYLAYLVVYMYCSKTLSFLRCSHRSD